MGEVSEDDTRPDESVLEQFYYYKLWKGRSAWTKHVIPARAKDPNTGFFVECYIFRPGSLDDINKEIEVELAYLPIKTVNFLNVKMIDIYPSRRKLTKIVEGSVIEIVGDTSFNPTEKYDPLDVIKVFKNYPGLDFTIPELESLLNTELPDSIRQLLIKSSQRQCLIEAVVSDTYKGMNKTQEELEIVKDISSAVNTLPELYEVYRGCTACKLGVERINRDIPEPTFGRLHNTPMSEVKGVKNTIMLIGEAPGKQEEENNKIFFPEAPAGDVLARVLTRSNIGLENCYYTNTVCCRPMPTDTTTQNGKPDTDNIQACSPRLKNEIAILKPKVIVLLGRFAYRAFYGKDPVGVLSSVGWQDDEKTIYFAAHPSYIARELSFSNPDQKLDIKGKYLAQFTEIKTRFDELSV